MNNKSLKLPNAEEIYHRLLSNMKDQNSHKSYQLVGLARGGAWVARRLAKDLELCSYGVINTSFHRDDFAEMEPKYFKRINEMVTKLPFDVNSANVIIIDDILHTGRTVRAAINELFDYGRPAKVDLAVLVDRGGRELPVHPTFKGGDINLPSNQIVTLKYVDGGQFEFVLEPKL
jgi:pyrimidine operon attenuation protein / uracil phosphoribosyltransferase